MAVTSVTEPRPQRLQRIRILPRAVVLALFAILALAALAVLGVLAFDRYYAGKVLPGVTVAGVDAAGLTAPELAARLEAVPVGPATIQIVSGGRSVTIPAQELGRRVDIDGAVSAAWPPAACPDRWRTFRSASRCGGKAARSIWPCPSTGRRSRPGSPPGLMRSMFHRGAPRSSLHRRAGPRRRPVTASCSTFLRRSAPSRRL